MSQENDPLATGRGDAGAADPAPTFKVELDIDDAPFLEEVEEEKAPEPEAPVEEKSEPPVPVEAPPKESLIDRLKAIFKEKRIRILVSAALVVFIIVPVVLFLVLPDKEPPVPTEPEVVIPEPRVIQLEDPNAVEETAPGFVYTLDPFFVERRGTEGEIRFLRCKFSIPTDNKDLYGEMMSKKIVLRDAIYYYLINKPVSFLQGDDGNLALKQDIISIVNENVSSGKITDLYIEDYLITGK